MADVAGIIEGASEGAGLGHYFLKHIERTKVLIHVVDVSGCEGRDPKEDFDKINEELARYNEKLLQKPQIVAANKIDVLGCTADPEDLEICDEYIEFKEYVEGKGYKVFPMSAPAGQGVQEIIAEAAKMLDEIEESDFEGYYEFFDFASDDEDLDYRKVFVDFDGENYIITGKQLEKIYNSTNFYDHGSRRYLFKYIENSGAYEMLKELGMQDGDTIKLFDQEFEYYDEDYIDDDYDETSE